MQSKPKSNTFRSKFRKQSLSTNLLRGFGKECSIFLSRHKLFITLKKTTIFPPLETTLKQATRLKLISKDQHMSLPKVKSNLKINIILGTFLQDYQLLMVKATGKLCIPQVGEKLTRKNKHTLLGRLMQQVQAVFVGDKMCTRLHKLEGMFKEQVE
jgi:hypothetical protein